jgi:hypothetical protein
MSNACRVPVALCLGLVLLSGCGGGRKRRASVEFHAEGVRYAVGRLSREIDRARAGQRVDAYAMSSATDAVERALRGLPERIEKKAATRVEERKAKAEEAIKLFAALRPVLVGLRFDEGEVKAKLAELGRLIDEVEKS